MDLDLVFMLDLRADAELIEAYIAWHRPGRVPAPVIAAIRRSGVISMTIHQARGRLVMVMQVAPGFTAARKAAIAAAEPEVARWEALMDRYQQRLPDSGDEKWIAMAPIFNLADHDAAQARAAGPK